MKDYVEMTYIEVTQPIGTFYIGRLKWQDLLDIAHADIRKIKEESSRSDSFDSYLGIQRELSPRRIDEIANYVHTMDATFPTSIILAINSKTAYIDNVETSKLNPDYVQDNVDSISYVNNIEIDEKKHKLKIRRLKDVASILDGQHRIEGLRNGFLRQIQGSDAVFEFNVTVFIDLDIDDQAQIFSVINKAQTKVNKSLVYDLYEFSRSRSPQKTAHDIVRLLNKREDSPFYRKFKILGTAANKETETIAQATFAELIIDYISRNPMKDRDVLRRKTILGTSHKLEPVKDEREKKRRIFRQFFIDERDETILTILWNYFDAIKKRWPEAWAQVGSGNILNKSTGVIAFMRFLRPAFLNLNMSPDVSINDFMALFKMVKINNVDFNREKYIPGSSGQSQLYHDLVEQSGISYPD